MLCLATAFALPVVGCGHNTYSSHGVPVLIPTPKDDRSVQHKPADEHTTRQVANDPPVSTTPAPVTEAAPANHGQERAAEVHERNEERKEEHDAAKAEAKEEKKEEKADDKAGKSKGKGKGKKGT